MTKQGTEGSEAWLSMDLNFVQWPTPFLTSKTCQHYTHITQFKVLRAWQNRDRATCKSSLNTLLSLREEQLPVPAWKLKDINLSHMERKVLATGWRGFHLTDNFFISPGEKIISLSNFIPSLPEKWITSQFMESLLPGTVWLLEKWRILQGTKPGEALKAQRSIPNWWSCWWADIPMECQVHFPLWNTFKGFLWKAPVSPGFLASLWCVTEASESFFLQKNVVY